MRTFLIGFLLVLGVPKASAHQTMEMVQAYAFDTTPGMSNGAAYVRIENTGPSDAKLVGVSTDVATNAEVHTHVQDGDLRRMVAVELPLLLAPDDVLVMQPGGIHIMLLGLNAPLMVGDKINLTLHFEGRHVRDMDVEVEVFGLESAEALIGAENISHEHMEHGEMDHSNHGS